MWLATVLILILVHIFNTTGRRDLDLEASYEDILKRTNEEIESVTALIEVVNNNPALKVGAEKSLNKDFIKKDDFGMYYLNEIGRASCRERV